MFILDTNVVSELRKETRADLGVVEWTRKQLPHQLFLSVTTVLELETGILLLERKDAAQGAILRAWFENAVLPSYADRIIPMDLAVARCCAQLHVPNRKPERDAVIAATAIVHGMTVVTRNAGDFEGCGVAVVNPWST